MNERMREPFHTLMWKASIGYNDSWSQVDPEVLEKFAELIINECVTICNDNIVPNEQQGDLTYNDGIMDCSIMIEKHFGVKE